MRVQVLVAAMNQQDHSLLKKMNIQSDVIVGNQCDFNSIEEFTYEGHSAKYLNFAEVGVGLNRNNALMRATGDICLFADEDVVLVDGYEEIVTKAFKEIPQADAIIFNTKTIGGGTGRRQNSKNKRLHFYNALNYGTSRISVRMSAIKRENITFHTCFGGGTQYSCGEDTLFIVDMLKAGLKIYTYPVCILTADQTKSTWFHGYNAKYLHDKGALFYAVSNKWSFFLCLQDLIRHPYLLRDANMNLVEALKIMWDGKRHFKSLVMYEK